MTEESIQDVAPVTTEEVSAQETVIPETEAAPVALTRTWKDEINEADPKELRSHERVAGIIGSEVQRAVQNYENTKLQELTKRAQREADDELIKAVEDNPDYFEQHYPKAAEKVKALQKQRALDEVQGLKGQAVNEFAENIGRAITDLPEWLERTQEEQDDIAKALVGKADNEVMAVFNKKVIDLVAKKRTAKAIEEYKAKELPKEREAIRLELTAELLKNSESPDTTRPKGQPGKASIADMSNEEYDRLFPPNVPLQDSIEKNLRR